ncbi:hypothetical protein CBR_g9088 [Chara braunii]|uniref:CCHC-type domain-containing protein n=1 Tax=Chara braunii TaxID=69332 RepID=A0A388KNQ2_CHABU|nr:hypothetical protein CBR_g9088 [Chara braunii]|eukprot:GBG71674.1 hypothetical protein CBR_g9088 [Chara braunii]
MRSLCSIRKNRDDVEFLRAEGHQGGRVGEGVGLNKRGCELVVEGVRYGGLIRGDVVKKAWTGGGGTTNGAEKAIVLKGTVEEVGEGHGCLVGETLEEEMASSDRREGRDRGWDRRDDGGREPDRRKEWRPYRKPMVCYNCDESGHYANQCPNRDRRQATRPSTSSDSRRQYSPRRADPRHTYSPKKKDPELRDKVVELSKGVASIKEHFDAIQAKKAEKARHKLEREREQEEELRRQEEEEARRAQEELRRAEKKRKKEKKEKQDADLRAEMKKDVTMHAAILMSEIKDDWINQWKTKVLPTLAGGLGDVKGKEKVVCNSESDHYSEGSGEDSDTSVTQDLSVKANRLCITEKHKRENNVVLENSPPMELPPKRTPQQVGGRMQKTNLRLTRARAKKIRTPISSKRKTPVRTPLVKVMKPAGKKSPPSGRMTPASRILARLRYRDSIMHELKDCNADELQRFCKEEGIPYVGKVDAIFDLAEHRAQQYATVPPQVEVIRIADSADVCASDSGETKE